jgi:hypothetical protein
MIKLLYHLFNHDKIDRLKDMLDTCEQRIQTLEALVEEGKGYKLKYRVTKLYVDDDEALLELFELAERNERDRVDHQETALLRRASATSQQSALYGLSNQRGLQQAGLASLGSVFGLH